MKAGHTYLTAHCSGGRMASGSVTLVLSGELTPGALWFTARSANSTSYSTQLNRKVVNVTTNRNCLKEHQRITPKKTAFKFLILIYLI